MNPISDKLIAWYKINKRDLPWRNTNDPYKIWLSEIILQQTQVVQGLNYYLKFVTHFPKIIDLANAPEDLVMRLWQGLGYYSRARNLHATAKYIQTNYKGIFPKTYSEIKELKGIGDYTAAAISSFAYKLPHAVVDGNVYRVVSRLYNLETPINSSQGKKEFQLIADEILNTRSPDIHNSAIMEFGALYCRPQNPKCEECTLRLNCMAFKNKTVQMLPIKINRTKIRNRYFSYIIFNYKEYTYIKKRNEKDIWQNLYEFYLVESAEVIDEELVLSYIKLVDLCENFTLKSKKNLSKHVLSHQHIYSCFYEIELKSALKSKEFLKVKRIELNNYGLPQLINKYLLSL